MDQSQAAADVAKRRRGMVAAFAAILLVAAAMLGTAYLMDLWPFAPLPTDQPKAQQGGSKETTRSVEATATPAPTVTLPPAEAQEVLYWEQIASADQIEDLVGDRFASFEFSEPAALADTGNVRVKATYRDGTVLNGWLLLRMYSQKWYVAMITRDGNPWATPVTGPTDAAVTKAIAEGNAANQEIPQAILAGGYTLVTIDKVTAGSGTAIVECTFSGGTEPATKGQITCISKDVDGARHWFITAFAKS